MKENRSSIYTVENWQEKTDQQKEYKQGQDEAQKLTERENRGNNKREGNKDNRNIIRSSPKEEGV